MQHKQFVLTEFHVSWERLWRGLGATTEGSHIRDELISRYSEPHRKYHTLQHLMECIEWYGAISQQAHHPAEIEAALWFHDAIYEIDRRDNEERCANLAHESLSAAGVLPESVARIERLILLTKHTEPPISLDEQYTVDIDLAIFGADEARFAEYERQIREEYAAVPEDEFSRQRLAILKGFLNREVIYYSDYFHSLLERRARDNLLRAMEQCVH